MDGIIFCCVPTCMVIFLHMYADVRMCVRMCTYKKSIHGMCVFTCAVCTQVYSEDKESLTVRLVEGSQPLNFTVSKADEVVKVIGIVLSRWQNQQPVRLTYVQCM